MKWIAVVLGIVGLALGALAAVYYTVPAHSLPSFLGAVKTAKPWVHRVRRGELMAVAAAVVFGIGVVVGLFVWRAPGRADSVWRMLIGK